MHLLACRHEGPGFNPQGVLMWKGDSPVSVVSLHWWPPRDWSLWPRLRRALSLTITRPLCQQCDNPTWSHTAFLSRFHTRCRFSFRLHNHIVGCWGEPCGELAISLHSYTVPQAQWFTHLLPVTRDPGSIPRWVLIWNQDSPVSVCLATISYSDLRLVYYSSFGYSWVNLYPHSCHNNYNH